ncbi:MAG: hypothetical protein GW947_02710 [Candidatus Pacebacteria bacterium]|nr:hypothetical protein [Candidatus Paceibacterota bacterium]PIR59808.1 MAG: hypothetical protein COU68_03595 [Candidatus Pacebacteria bacterium CG10_big_fil_rev_8_21_14_0_10_45_6]
MRYVVSFWFCLLGFTVWSYGLADPNIVFTSWQPYWVFQNWIWSLARTFPEWYTAVYVLLIGSLFWLSLQLKNWLQKFSKISLTQTVLWFLLLISPLLFSYNALSHDVFNYLFNAKMVMVYHANPHVQTALEFATDDWTRFMHNTHTPAPYGYGWTGLSLVPYLLGFGKFTWSWLVFRLFSVASLVLVFVALQQLARRMGKKVSLSDAAVFFLNPLVLIEVVANSHNDLWMLAPALFGLSFLLARKRFSLGWRVGISLLLLAFSISIKYATVTLLPVWLTILALERFEAGSFGRLQARLHIPKRFLIVLTKGIWERVFRSLPYVAAVSLLLPLFTNQSQQYLPWYLTWSLVWLPLISARKWRRFWLVCSIAALLRYVPWLYVGGYEEQTVQWQKYISWGIPAVWLAWQSMGIKTKTENSSVLIGKTIDV